MFHVIMYKIFLLALTALFLSCQSSDSSTPSPEPERPVMEVISFALQEYPGVEILIDNTEKNIYITLPYGANPGTAHINYTVTPGVKATPESGAAVNLSQNPRVYLSVESGQACSYGIVTQIAPSSSVVLRNITNREYYVEGRVDGQEIIFRFPSAFSLESLTFEAETLDGTTFEPALDSGIDLTSPRTLKVTAPDGKTFKEYVIKAETYEAETAVRGLYLPAPHHSASFSTYENARKSIDLMASLNFNTLFVCTWCGSKTAWDSQVLLANSTYPDAAAGNMYSGYRGGSGDALKDIIDLAHEKEIKVIFWFEYGFMHRQGGVNHNDPILQKHPEWLGIGSDGKPSAYNNNDFYLNAYDPAVQKFMLDLMVESLERYPDVDGIQGDDRLPAMPRNSGYNEVTREAFKAAKGYYPPEDHQNSEWVRWRLDNLNAFAGTMYRTLKAKDSSLCVCFAPNKYPWCEENLMQDWPSWIRNGNVDLLTVQFYVLPTYESDVAAALNHVASASERNLLNPAMILKNGSRILDRDVLISQLQYNRSKGTCGESQFWFDGIYTDYVQDVFRVFYPSKAVFPEY